MFAFKAGLKAQTALLHIVITLSIRGKIDVNLYECESALSVAI